MIDKIDIQLNGVVFDELRDIPLEANLLGRRFIRCSKFDNQGQAYFPYYFTNEGNLRIEAHYLKDTLKIKNSIWKWAKGTNAVPFTMSEAQDILCHLNQLLQLPISLEQAEISYLEIGTVFESTYALEDDLKAFYRTKEFRPMLRKNKRIGWIYDMTDYRIKIYSKHYEYSGSDPDLRPMKDKYRFEVVFKRRGVVRREGVYTLQDLYINPDILVSKVRELLNNCTFFLKPSIPDATKPNERKDIYLFCSNMHQHYRDDLRNYKNGSSLKQHDKKMKGLIQFTKSVVDVKQQILKSIDQHMS